MLLDHRPLKSLKLDKHNWKPRKEKIPRHHSIRLDVMFKTIKLPTSIAYLNPGLSYMNAYYFSHLFSLTLNTLSLFSLPLSLFGHSKSLYLCFFDVVIDQEKDARFFLDLSLSLSLYKVAFLGKLYFDIYRFRNISFGFMYFKKHTDDVSLILSNMFGWSPWLLIAIGKQQ